MRNVALGYSGLVFNRTFVVWPGVIRSLSVSNGFVYIASPSTAINVWLAMVKKSSSLSAALISRKRYVFPGFTFSLYVSANDYVDTIMLNSLQIHLKCCYKLAKPS